MTGSTVQASGVLLLSPAVDAGLYVRLQDFLWEPKNDDILYPSLRCCWRLDQAGQQLLHQDVSCYWGHACGRWLKLVIAEFLRPAEVYVNGCVKIQAETVGRLKFVICNDSHVSEQQPTVLALGTWQHHTPVFRDVM